MLTLGDRNVHSLWNCTIAMCWNNCWGCKISILRAGTFSPVKSLVGHKERCWYALEFDAPSQYGVLRKHSRVSQSSVKFLFDVSTAHRSVNPSFSLKHTGAQGSYRELRKILPLCSLLSNIHNYNPYWFTSDDVTNFIDHERTFFDIITNLGALWHCFILHRSKGKAQRRDAEGKASALSWGNTCILLYSLNTVEVTNYF